MFDASPLRSCCEWLSDYDYANHICNQAADEIERLQAELARLKEIGVHGCDCSMDDACLFARQRDEAKAENKRLQGIVSQLQHDETCDSSAMWKLVCRFLDVMDIKPLTWHETTPEQIERAIEQLKQFKEQSHA